MLTKSVVFLVAAACAPAPSPVAHETAADSLRGTWRVVRFTVRNQRDSTETFPLGLAPRGYLVYDATGHVFFQMTRPTAMDSLWLGLRRVAPDAVLARLQSGFLAHFGTYTVDAGRRTVTHHVEGEMPPRSGSFEVATPFRLTGDSLILGSDSARAWRFVRMR